jgi:4-hydroxybenzoyl-CoA reductase subunit beta
MRIPGFEYHAPTHIDECGALLSALGEGCALLAGGTELLVRMKYRLTRPSHLVAVSRVEGMGEIGYDRDTGLVLGAGVKLSALISSAAVREHYPVISYAASLVAASQIRNMATLGGNICQDTRCFYYNRSAAWRKAVDPCVKRGGAQCHAVRGSSRCFAVYQGDLAPVLIALGARALVVRNGQTSDVPLESLYSGEGRAPFGSGRFIVWKIVLPPANDALFAAYRKYRLRDGLDFPIAGVALAVERAGADVASLRICLTGVWSSPVLVKQAEETAKGKPLSPDRVAELAELAYWSAHPVENVEGTAARRRSMVRLMTREGLLSAL